MSVCNRAGEMQKSHTRKDVALYMIISVIVHGVVNEVREYAFACTAHEQNNACNVRYNCGSCNITEEAYQHMFTRKTVNAVGDKKQRKNKSDDFKDCFEHMNQSFR